MVEGTVKAGVIYGAEQMAVLRDRRVCCGTSWGRKSMKSRFSRTSPHVGGVELA
jgi:hypothetical protein